MLWEVEITPRDKVHDLERARIGAEYELLCGAAVADGGPVSLSSRGYLLEGDLSERDADRLMTELLIDPLVETAACHGVPRLPTGRSRTLEWTILLKPGVMDPVAQSVLDAARDLGIDLASVRTFRRYALPTSLPAASAAVLRKVLANDAIEQIVVGSLQIEHLTLGSKYGFRRITVPLRELDDDGLRKVSRDG